MTGFVDSIEGSKMVTPSTGLSKQNVALFKVVVNNGSNKRVRVLFWGTSAAEYSPKIVDRTVSRLFLSNILVIVKNMLMIIISEFFITGNNDCSCKNGQA